MTYSILIIILEYYDLRWKLSISFYATFGYASESATPFGNTLMMEPYTILQKCTMCIKWKLRGMIYISLESFPFIYKFFVLY
jgi:hypothetical protein